MMNCDLPLIKSIFKGLLTFTPGYIFILNKKRRTRKNSCSISQFCYSLWCSFQSVIDEREKFIIGEIGPAGSCGLGIIAVLLGAKEYHFIDIESNYILDRNLELFDKIVELFRIQADCIKWDSINLPHKNKYSDINYTKAIDDYNIFRVRKELERFLRNEKSKLFFKHDWKDVQSNYFDVIISRAVMEHVNNPKMIYPEIFRGLKKNGLMIHDIELHSHALSKKIDGHLHLNKFIWKLIVGKRPYLLNRLESSQHLDIIKKKFDIIDSNITYKDEYEYGFYVIAQKREVR